MKRFSILFIGLSILAAHLLATFLYLAPVNPVTSQYKPAINEYMNSFFSQNWGLFAPAPATSSSQLLYRCQDQNEWTPWYDMLTPLYKEHHKFPITYRGKMTYIYQSLIRELFNDSVTQNLKFTHYEKWSSLKMPTSIAKESSFNNLAYAVNDLCRAQKKDLSKFEFQISRIYAPDFSKRFTDEKGKKEVVTYPTVELAAKSEELYAKRK